MTAIIPSGLNNCCNSLNGMSYRQEGLCTTCAGMIIIYYSLCLMVYIIKINFTVGLVARDPHFLLPLTNGDQLCFNVQGEPDFPFSLINDRYVQLNGVFVLPGEDESNNISRGASFLGTLGLVLQSPVMEKVNVVKVFGQDRSVVVGDNTLTVVNNKQINLEITEFVIISVHTVHLPHANDEFAWLNINTDLGFSFTVRFYKRHLDLFLTDTSGLTKEAHGLIGNHSNTC